MDVAVAVGGGLYYGFFYRCSMIRVVFTCFFYMFLFSTGVLWFFLHVFFFHQFAGEFYGLDMSCLCFSRVLHGFSMGSPRCSMVFLWVFCLDAFGFGYF